MNLATRCPSCGTVFRVVQDQLRMSQGWVRCGRCNEVFAALSSLFDIDRDPPPDWRGEAPPAPAAAPEPEHDATAENALRREPSSSPFAAMPPFAAPPSRDSPPMAMPLLRRGEGDPADSPAMAPAPAVSTGSAASGSASAAGALSASAARAPTFTMPVPFEHRAPPEIAGAPAVIERRAGSGAGPVLVGADRRAAAGPASYGRTAFDPADTPSGPPLFVERAAAAARWRRGASRPAATAAVFGLAIALLAQAGFEFRGDLAERWTAARAPVERLCQRLGCGIPPNRRLDQLTVETAALSRRTDKDPARLSLAIRNHGDRPAAAPAIELSLSDERGEVVVRRVILPTELPVASDAAVPARSELSLQLPLSIADAGLAGFSVEIFYP